MHLKILAESTWHETWRYKCSELYACQLAVQTLNVFTAVSGGAGQTARFCTQHTDYLHTVQVPARKPIAWYNTAAHIEYNSYIWVEHALVLIKHTCALLARPASDRMLKISNCSLDNSGISVEGLPSADIVDCETASVKPEHILRRQYEFSQRLNVRMLLAFRRVRPQATNK